MTRLTDITNRVSAPHASDRLYIVDVSDTTEGPGGTSGYTTPSDLLQTTYAYYPDRTAAAAAIVPASVSHCRVGDLTFAEDASGTALTTGDGRNWSPDGDATYEHWGATGNGTTDDSDAIRACHDWCIDNRVTCRPRGATYRVTKRILYYDVNTHGAGKEFHLMGSGRAQTVFSITDNVTGSLFLIRGDVSVPAGSRATNWSFSEFQVKSDGQVDANVFRIDIATAIEFRNVGVNNCRGTALRLREVWDSELGISAVNCGDDGAGTGPDTANKYSVEINNYWGDSEVDRGSNNVDFPQRSQIESARWRSLYIGAHCKEIAFAGKIHGRVPTPVIQPHVLIDGASRLSFYGANLTQCGDVCIRLKQSSGGFNCRNITVVGCLLHSQGNSCVELNSANRVVVIGNELRAVGIAGVHLKSSSGSGNIIHSNTIEGVGKQIQIDASNAVAPVELPGELELSTPGSGVKLRSPNGATHRLSVSNAGVLLFDGQAV